MKLNRSDAAAIENMRGWLTTVVSRISLDMLRARRARREQFTDGPLPEPISERVARMVLARGSAQARFARPAIVNGMVGAVVVREGRVLAAVGFALAGERITEMDLVVNPELLRNVRV